MFVIAKSPTLRIGRGSELAVAAAVGARLVIAAAAACACGGDKTTTTKNKADSNNWQNAHQPGTLGAVPAAVQEHRVHFQRLQAEERWLQTLQ
jgi:hypothetical protein